MDKNKYHFDEGVLVLLKQVVELGLHWSEEQVQAVKNTLDRLNSVKSTEKSNGLLENFDSLSKRKQEDVLCIFDFWNSYKSQGNWISHKKLTHDMVQAIVDNLKKYTIEDICIAIDNYVKVLVGDKYFWDYVWVLSIFLTVGYERRKNTPRKWWQFLPENFVEENYLKAKLDKIEEVEDINPDITLNIIKYYRILVNNKRFEPNSDQRVKFVKASIEMNIFFRERYKDISENERINLLTECLQKNYVDKGEVLHPGHFCSRNTWDVLLPQYLAELGIE